MPTPSLKAFDCDPEAIGPGGSVQLQAKPGVSGFAAGVMVSKGLRIEKVYVGKVRGSVAEVRGQPIRPGTYLLVVVTNTTDKTMAARGRWYVADTEEAAKAARLSEEAASAATAKMESTPAKVEEEPGLAVLTERATVDAAVVDVREAPTVPALEASDEYAGGRMEVSPEPTRPTRLGRELCVYLTPYLCEQLLKGMAKLTTYQLHDQDKNAITGAVSRAMKGA